MRSVRSVEIDGVKTYLTANPVFKERERDGLHIAHCFKMYVRMQGAEKGIACHRSTRKKKYKSFHKSSFFRAHGFLPLTGDALPPLVSANIRGSEDGAENIPPAPPFRPINGIHQNNEVIFCSCTSFCFLFTIETIFKLIWSVYRGLLVCFLPVFGQLNVPLKRGGHVWLFHGKVQTLTCFQLSPQL